MAYTQALPGYRTVRRPVRTPYCCQPKKGDTVEGSTHAATGLLLGAGVALLTSAGHAHGVAAWDAVGRDLEFGVLTAAFALWPDSDHPKASFAYAASGLSHGLSHVIAAVSGGHRAGTHSIPGTALVAAGIAAGTLWYPGRLALAAVALLTAICIAAALHATGFARHRLPAFLAAAVIAGIAVASPEVRPDLWWVFVLGAALHITEDMFTGHGVSLLWPFTSRRLGGDGHQPAARTRGRARRAPSAPRRRAASARTRPVTPAVPSAPARAPRGPVSMCLPCWTSDCVSCRGQGCKCPQPATSHPNRARKVPPVVTGAVEPPDDDSVPPF